MDLSKFSPQQRIQAESIIRQAAKSRMWTITNLYGVKYIEDWQAEVVTCLDEGVTKVSIKSGHGVGKTTLCAWLAIHFLLFRNDVKIIVTSPSQKQLKDGLIPEITKWINRLPPWMRDQLEITSDRVTRKPDTLNNFISFRTARKENPEALAGVHAENVLIIVDEASGVDDVIYETGQGALSTKGAIAVLIGNPTKPNGFFFDTHNALSALWKTFTVSCADSTRVSAEYITGIATSYGLRSREYRVRVLGLFPMSGISSIIPKGYLQSAQGRDIAPDRGQRKWGVDVGRGGDPSALVVRDNFTVYDMAEYYLEDTMDLVGQIEERYDATPERDRPHAVYVDTIGVGGPVYDRLKQLGLPVVSVNVADAASRNERYHRLRDELWYLGRDWFEGKNVRIPNKNEHSLAEKLVEELSVVNSSDDSGVIKVESKKAMRARGIKSPNLADGFLITFSNSAVISSGGMSGSSDFRSLDTSKYRPPHVV